MAPTINCVPVQPTTDCYFQFGTSFIHVSPVDFPDIPLAKKWTKRPTLLNAKYATIAEDIANFEVLPDDIWVVTFPKCGTTWTQEMVRLLNTDLDYDQAEKIKVEDWFSFIEGSSWFDRKALNSDGYYVVSSVNRTINKSSPRYIKSHLPIELLPKSIWTIKPKIIFTSRNPKDTAVSFFHHYRNMNGYHGELNEFMKMFLADETVYAPFYDHVLNFWNSRDEPNIMFLTYEQMKSDMMAVLRKTQQFLGKSFADDQLERLSRHLHVDAMRHNQSANNSNLMGYIRNSVGIESVDTDFE